MTKVQHFTLIAQIYYFILAVGLQKVEKTILNYYLPFLFCFYWREFLF